MNINYCTISSVARGGQAAPESAPGRQGLGCQNRSLISFSLQFDATFTSDSKDIPKEINFGAKNMSSYSGL